MINVDEETTFNRIFYGSMYESVNRESLLKSKPEQQEYLQQLFQDADEMQVDDEEEVESDDEYDVFQKPTPKVEQENDGEQNSLLAVGYQNDRSFVVRGNKIGVFKHQDDELEFSTSIRYFSTYTGTSLIWTASYSRHEK